MTPGDRDPIQQQLIAARRAQILDAATKVFAEKGFSRATMRDVAATATIAVGTIYNYFPNKTALLLGLLTELNETEQRPEHFAQSADMDLESFFQQYIVQRFEALSSGGMDVLQVLLSEILINRELREPYYTQVVEPTMALAEQYFKQWAEQGRTAPLDPSLTPRILAGSILGIVMLRLIGDRYLQEHWHAVPETISALFLEGLRPQTGADHAADDQV